MHATSLRNKSNPKNTYKSAYEGNKYPCDVCDFLATQKGSLRKHKQSVHEGNIYPCDACDFLVKTKRKQKKTQTICA